MKNSKQQQLTGNKMSANKYGDIITTDTSVPTSKNIAYISLVEVDSFIAGSIEQQQRYGEPHRRHFN
jgi:hypothetical protein